MAITKLNSLAIPAGTVEPSDISYPLTNFSSTGIDDNATSTAITIDASQNVGINNASPSELLSIIGTGGTAKIRFDGDSSNLQNNFIGITGYDDLIIASDESNSGTASTIQFRVDAAERMRIDSSGNLCVGTTSAGVAGVSVATGKNIGFKQANGESLANMFRQNSSGAFVLAEGYQYSSSPNGFASSYSSSLSRTAIWLGDSVRFYADPASTVSVGTDITPSERMRIDSSGNVGIGTTSIGSKLEVVSSSVTTAALQVKSQGTSNYQRGMIITFGNRTPNDNQSYFWAANDTTNTKGIFYSNGGLANYSANNQNLCDEREKKNIEVLDSTWGRLKNWELKKFHYNEDEDNDDKRYGVIAQQIAPHCPEVITTWVKQVAQPAKLDDQGNEITPAIAEVTRMGVKEQQMMWMAIKALQEAQIRIETLEAEVAALKGA